jgi:hypothetical protein
VPAAPDGLLHVLQDSDNWLRACAVLVAGRVTESPVRSMLAQLARSDEDDMVREAADSALKGSLNMNPATPIERIIFLRRVPLFFELTPVDLKQVGAIATERTYPDGMVIAQQGEPGDEMYVIVSGEIRVLTGANMELARRKTGEYVGEMAIISQEPRMASLVAAGDVRLLCIDQKNFEGLLRERPETSLAVMRGVARLQAHAARPKCGKAYDFAALRQSPNLDDARFCRTGTAWSDLSQMRQPVSPAQKLLPLYSR